MEGGCYWEEQRNNGYREGEVYRRELGVRVVEAAMRLIWTLELMRRRTEEK